MLCLFASRLQNEVSRNIWLPTTCTDFQPTLAPPPLTMAKHFMHDGRALETGAAIIYSGNQYLFDLTERVNLTRVNEVKSEGPNTGLWDGEQFVLTTTNWGLANLARMAWRYGM